MLVKIKIYFLSFATVLFKIHLCILDAKICSSEAHFVCVQAEKKWAKNWSNSENICTIYNKSKREELSCLMLGDRWQPNRSTLVLLAFGGTTMNWWIFSNFLSSNTSHVESEASTSSISVLLLRWNLLFISESIFCSKFTKERKTENCLRKLKHEKWWKCNEGNNECQKRLQKMKTFSRETDARNS